MSSIWSSVDLESENSLHRPPYLN